MTTPNRNSTVSSNPNEMKPSSRDSTASSNRYEHQHHDANNQRRSYNQQNSSNMNDIMGTIDPNILHQENLRKAQAKMADDKVDAQNLLAEELKNPTQPPTEPPVNPDEMKRVRQPPGGFSNGLW